MIKDALVSVVLEEIDGPPLVVGKVFVGDRLDRNFGMKVLGTK